MLSFDDGPDLGFDFGFNISINFNFNFNFDLDLDVDLGPRNSGGEISMAISAMIWL